MRDISNVRLFAHKVVDSTMNVAEKYLESFSEGNFAVSADAQTSGVGRRGRKWDSPKGNLYATIAKKPSAIGKATYQLPFVAAVAVGAFIEEYFHKQCQYKWPNDIIVNGRKAAGILLRACDSVVLIGVGVNINTAPLDTAVALGASGLEIEELCRHFVAVFDQFYGAWDSDGFARIRKIWMKGAVGLNQRVIIGSDAHTAGKFLEIDSDGAMILDNNGAVVRIVDAEHVRFV